MDIKLLKSSILSNSVPDFLVFITEEPALSRQYIESIASTLNKAFKYYNSAREVIYDMTTNLREDYLYVVSNDKDLLSNQDLVDALVDLRRNVIICFDSLDKSSNFYKVNKNFVVEFKKLDEHTLLAYAQKLCKTHKCNINQDKLITLIEYCRCDLGVLLNELDKIFLLEQENSNVLVDYLLNNGFVDYRDSNIFEFINMVLNKDPAAFDYLLRLNDSPVSIVFNMYNMAKKRLLSSKNTFYGTVMQLCHSVYSGIIDGTLGADYAIKYLLMRLYE